MKKAIIFFAAIIMIAFFSNKVTAQVTVSNDANAEIITPITLTADVDLEFGKLAVQTLQGGVVELTPAAATVATSTLGVTLLTGTTRTAAKYTVGGIQNYVYTITVPVGSIPITSGLNTMDVYDFVFLSIATPSATGGTLDVNGTDNFYVGAKLQVAQAQAPGVYTGTFNVTVNYN